MTRVTTQDLPLTETDVLVVGAGPTGLIAGLVLARRGVRAVVIDQKPGPTRQSRALVVQARSMELYHQLGLAQQVLDGATTATRVEPRPGTRGFGVEVTQDGETGFPGIHVFEQSRNEELLAQTLRDAGAELSWNHRLVDLLHVDEQGVEALVDGPDGLSRIRARWCIAADGAHSAVRGRLNIPFEGITDPASFCVADLRGVRGASPDAVQLRFGATVFGLLFPLGPAGHVRLVSMVGSAQPAQDAVLTAVTAELGLTYTAVDWFSTYRVHHRLAARFRSGPVFLAGDAAHVHSPVGGQGMNTGLQDAHHLANLLADVAQDRLDATALDRFESERRPVARRLVNVTDRLFGVVARPGATTAGLRRQAGRLVAVAAPRLATTPAGRRVGGWLGQYRIRYHFLPSNTPTPAWADDPAVGRRLPPCGDNHEALRRFTWQLHGYGTRAERPAMPEWMDGPFDFGPDPSGRLRAERLYLVRPDGFVAGSFPLAAGRTTGQDVQACLAVHRIRCATLG